MIKHVLILAALCLVHAVAPGSLASAHDYWLEPTTFRPAVGQPVPIVIRVGQDFSGTTEPFIPAWFTDYAATGPSGRLPVSGEIGDDPAGSFTPDAAGNWVVGLHTTPSLAELDAPKFDKYLEAEGLEWVLAARDRRGDAASLGRELYSRCAKALVRAGTTGPGAGFDKLLGYPLEILPERDPHALGSGGELPVRVLYRGEPLAGVLLVAAAAADPSARQRRRTDASGRAVFTLQATGVWLIKGVHIIELPASDSRAEWESFWASLTFELSGP